MALRRIAGCHRFPFPLPSGSGRAASSAGMGTGGPPLPAAFCGGPIQQLFVAANLDGVLQSSAECRRCFAGCKAVGLESALCLFQGPLKQPCSNMPGMVHLAAGLHLSTAWPSFSSRTSEITTVLVCVHYFPLSSLHFFFFNDIFVQSISVSSVAAWNLLRPSTKPCSCFPTKTCIVQNDTCIHPFLLIYLSGLRHPQVCTGIYSISSSTSWPRMAWACLG